MDYTIIDTFTGLPIKKYSEKELAIEAKKNNITKFDMYNKIQKRILKEGIEYIIDKETLEKFAILKQSEKDEKYIYFKTYSELIDFFDKK